MRSNVFTSTRFAKTPVHQPPKPLHLAVLAVTGPDTRRVDYKCPIYTYQALARNTVDGATLIVMPSTDARDAIDQLRTGICFDFVEPEALAVVEPGPASLPVVLKRHPKRSTIPRRVVHIYDVRDRELAAQRLAYVKSVGRNPTEAAQLARKIFSYDWRVRQEQQKTA
jgi:hypothetical protein